MSRQLTSHFTIEEMEFSTTAARKGIDNRLPPDLIPNARRVAIALEVIRDYYDRPVRVLSCYRCPPLNRAVGGSPRSAHMQALAADFIVPGIPTKELALTVKTLIPYADQVIEEFGQWVHLGLTDGEPRGQLFAASKVDGRTVYLPLLPVA